MAWYCRQKTIHFIQINGNIINTKIKKQIKILISPFWEYVSNYIKTFLFILLIR